MYVTINFSSLSHYLLVEDMGHGSCYVVEEQKLMFHRGEKEREKVMEEEEEEGRQVTFNY